MENNTSFKISQVFAGLNGDSIISQIREGQLTFAMNALVENFDGNMVTYQNEQSNIHCMDFKEGFVVIGHKNIVEQNRTIFFLVNGETGECEIGQKSNNGCAYTTIISSPCLNFKIHKPILKVVVKTTNCSTQLYWTDNFNPRRWIDLDDLPFVEIPNPDNENQPIKTDEVDCNKLLVQPNFTVPTITPISVDTGGSLKMGVYQFAVQYANILGEGYGEFYGFTNPVGIFEVQVSPFTDLPTTKSIKVHISNIDTSGLYDHFNLVVIETVNNISTPKLVNTFPINGHSTFDYTYTGNAKNEIQLSIEELFQRFPYYDTAGDVTTSDNSLLWVDLKSTQKYSLQKAFNNIVLNWVTTRIPYTSFEAYKNGVNMAEFRSYLRDEVYAFEIAPVYSNGRIGESCHIPGPVARPLDTEIINNQDALEVTENPCDVPTGKQRWQVYNTGTNKGFTQEYLSSRRDDCYRGTYEYGEFAYWQSSVKYPNNRDIWGDLADTPIRFHKFPDCLVTPHHDGGAIYPIGVMIDPQSLYNALELIPEDERRQIVGFKITRANRAGNESIKAKGMLFNVGTYSRDNQSYYYPNYPFNDLRPDPFISSTPVGPHSGSNSGTLLQGFNDESKRRFTFHSPNTAFGSPRGIDSGYLKVESVEYGKTRSHFVSVIDNAKYKFLTPDTIRVAFAAGMSAIAKFEISAGFPSGIKASPGLELANAIPVFSATLDVLRNIAQAVNYGWSFNSVGKYTNSFLVPNDGNKNRSIEFGSYLASGQQSVDDNFPFNNYLRETSVYIRTKSGLPFPHEYGNIPIDNSRFTLSEYGCGNAPETFRERDVSSIYASIKRIFNDQYGPMFSYESIDTGYYSNLYDNNGQAFTVLPPVYGGDTFIGMFALKRKHSFFLSNTVKLPDQTDITLDKLGNVGYPIYYYSTGPRDITVDFSDLDTEINAIVDPGFWNIMVNLVSGGIRPITSGLIILTRIMGAYLSTLGVPNVNLECSTTKVLNEVGNAYLFAYGIPYFFCESDINVEYRQATNDREGDFYPHVAGDVPDLWLQEVNVPIVQDNTYNYNITYSKQIKELPITHLRPDFDPNKLCQTQFPNRIIYSQESTLEETKNNWLIYRPVSYKDLPKSYGKITAIDGLEDRKVLVRFENKSQLYNVYQTTDTSTGTVFMGNPIMFSQPPLDFAETDTGYNGSQNKFMLKTEIGHITTDSERGQIFLYRGNQINDISATGMSKFFTQNLPFAIRSYFPNALIDNHYNGIGLTGVYDPKYNRVIITKRDYRPLDDRIQYEADTDTYFIPQGKKTITVTKEVCGICPEGYAKMDDDSCQKIITVPAIQSSNPIDFVVARKTSFFLTRYGTSIYDSYNVNGTGIYTNVNTPYWINDPNNLVNGPGNRTSIWNGTSNLPINQWVGFSTQFTVPDTKTYYVGISADNIARIKLDCNLLVEFDPFAMGEQHRINEGYPNSNMVAFEKWHIYPITLTAGTHFIQVEGLNQGDLGNFGCQIYNNTSIELLAATQDSDLDIIFDTSSFDGQTLGTVNYTCPGDVGCSNVFYEGNQYVCKSVDVTTPICTTIVENIEVEDTVPVSLDDDRYFCNLSFTISYSFTTGSWVSFHSFIPNYYIQHPGVFETGINKDSSIWLHNTDITFQRYYGNIGDYVLEYPLSFVPNDEIVTNFKDYTTIIKYTSPDVFYEVDNTYFNKAVIYNNSQCTGVLNLIPRLQGNLGSYFQYPKMNIDSKDILVTKKDSCYQFNTFWDIVADKTKPFYSVPCNIPSLDKVFNSNLDYTNRSFNKPRIRSQECRVRLIKNDTDQYKLVSKFMITQTTKSVI